MRFVRASRSCRDGVRAAQVFNCYVAERLRQETFDARLEGDLTSRKGLGGGSATARETLTGPLIGRDLLLSLIHI